MERARTSKLAAKVPDEYWPLADEMYVYVLNRLPTSRNKANESPMQAPDEGVGLPAVECTPNITYLRIYGSRAYVYILDKTVCPQANKMSGHSGKVYRVRVDHIVGVARGPGARFIKDLQDEGDPTYHSLET